MSTSRSMSRLLRSSSRHLARPSCTAFHRPSLVHPASSLRPSVSLSSSLSSARRSFFSRTAASADSQPQSASTASTSDQQSAQQPSSASSSSNSATNNSQQTPPSSSSASSSTPNPAASTTQSSSSSSSTSAQQPADSSALQQQLSQAQQQLSAAQSQQKDTYDRLLRTAAEMENLRRTTRLDVDNARKYATTGFAKSVLEVADTLELAGKSAREALQGGALKDDKAVAAVQSLLEGIEMTERVLLKTLTDNGVVKQEAMGAKFNPHEHHGLFEVEGEAGQEAGTIAHVMKQGYKIHDRVLRAAQVGTVKAKKA